MKFQKILLLVSLILAAVCIVYSFVYCTGSIATLYNYVTQRKYQNINCADTYYAAQNFNMTLLILSIIYLIMIVLLYATQCGKRRNYYISNYVVSIAAVVYMVVFAIICIAMNGSIMGMFLNDINWDAYRAAYNEIDAVTGLRKNPYYDDSVVMFVLGIVLHLIVLADAVMIGLNLLWKRKLMKGEQQLLANNEEQPQPQPVEQEVA